MGTYKVKVGDATYEVDAPDGNTAWKWANQEHYSSDTSKMPKSARPEPSLGEKALAVGKAAVGLVGGGAAGAVGQLVGTAKGLAQNATEGTYGTQKGAEQLQQSAEQTAQQYAAPFMPSDQLAQSYVEKGAETLAPLQAFPMMSEWDQIATLAKASKPQIASQLSQSMQKAAEVAPQAPIIKQAVQGIKKVMPEAKAVSVEKDMGKLAAKAAQGSVKAKAQLAEEAKVNPEALKSAEDLGIDLPIDVYSENELLRQTAGLGRSKVGEESAIWRDSVQAAADKADEALQSVGGAGSKAEMSQQVHDTLTSSHSDIKNQAKELYTEVDNAVPKETIIDPINIKSTINDIIGEVGIDNLTTAEKQLLKSVSGKQGTTYGALLRLKSQIGDALSGKQAQNPFGSIDTGSLKRLYGSIKNDQMDNIRAIAGDEMADKLHFANRLTQKQKALEDRMVNVFGKEGDGSIATLMDRAINAGAKGDVTPLNKLLKVVPQEMHKDVITTAISDLVRSQRNTDVGSFDFGRYAKLYSGLMRNRPVYETVINAIGKDKAPLLQDIHNVAVKVNKAQANVKTTGAGMQQILEGIQSNGLMSNIIQKSVQHGVNKIAGNMLNIEGLFKQPSDTLKALSDLLRSEEFKNLAVESATKIPKEVTIKRMVNSKDFKMWANTITKRSGAGKVGDLLSNPSLWVLNSMTQQKVQDQNKSKF